jgi:TrmH family RNA methyltransferase
MLTKSQVKYIQSLNDKKFRREYGVFVAEGPKVVNDILAGNTIEAVGLYATAPWWEQNRAVKNSLPFATFYELDEQELAKISFLSTPNQVLAVFRQPDYQEGVSVNDTITVLLDGIQDPGNLGTIIRIADWFGLSQVVASRDSVDVYNPKVVQATMGSIARVKVSYENLREFTVRHPGVPLYASILEGKPLSSFPKVSRGMLLVGNESKGISEELVSLAQHRVTIPRFGKAESLNAAVATGIILSHLV